jgi:hypothetical protein
MCLYALLRGSSFRIRLQELGARDCRECYRWKIGWSQRGYDRRTSGIGKNRWAIKFRVRDVSTMTKSHQNENVLALNLSRRLETYIRDMYVDHIERL